MEGPVQICEQMRNPPVLGANVRLCSNTEARASAAMTPIVTFDVADCAVL
jgi:hypothetical protein